MGKKAKEFKSGDFIFAKVKGYPAWPARVQSYNGKKYFVYFYGTGETANLPPNMIFDYAENKTKFLTKAVKRRDFNEGAKQIELDFANNTPLEQILVPAAEAAANVTNDDSAIDESMDMTADNSADDTVADTTGTTQNETAVEDSDDAGALVIDEGKQPKGRKSAAKTPAKEAVKTPKTPRTKAKKDEGKKEESKEDGEGKEDGKKEEEIVSRSGRKIRPKRYMDEQTEENTTLPSPMPKKRRPASIDKDKADVPQKPEKTTKSDFNNVSLSELEDLKEPFKSADLEKENILMAYLPTGNYVGIKLFQCCPTSFKNDSAKLQWDKQAASNAVTLKMQLERGQISPQSIAAQLVMDLNLTDEEKAALDKERETEEKKSRVNFLKCEMKLIELDAKIKSCLCLEKADTELCLKLLDELGELNVRPLMLLKHPTCLETVKRMRAYVGNTPSWDLSETDALMFGKQAHRIRKQADSLYSNLKTLFSPPAGLSFWEYFSERVLQFKRATAALSADELLEMVHEPLEMTQPTSHTMQSAIDAANIEEPMDKEEKADAVVEETPKEKVTPKKKAQKKETPKKVNKKDAQKKDTGNKDQDEASQEDKTEDSNQKDAEKESEIEDTNEKEIAQNEEDDTTKEDAAKKDTSSKKNAKKAANAKSKKASTPSKPTLKRQSSRKQTNDMQEPESEETAETTEPTKEATEPNEAPAKDNEEPKNGEDVTAPVTNGDGKEIEEVTAENKTGDNSATEADIAEDKQKGKEKEKEDEPRAKRSRSETKKTDVAPKSPARTRKAKV